MMLICFVVICPKMRLVTSGWSYADKVVTQFHTNSLFISYHDSSLLDFHVYFGLKCVDRKCMNNVQGRRPNEEKVCLPTLLENVEGQAQVDGKVEGNWMCQKKVIRNIRQRQINLLHHLQLQLPLMQKQQERHQGQLPLQLMRLNLSLSLCFLMRLNLSLSCVSYCLFFWHVNFPSTFLSTWACPLGFFSNVGRQIPLLLALVLEHEICTFQTKINMKVKYRQMMIADK